MGKSELNRRKFLRTSLVGSAGALLAPSVFANTKKKTDNLEATDKKIIKRKLGNTGIELPIVSFGVMRADTTALVQAALKEGIVHFDTAHGYQRGRNEEMLGEAFKGVPRDSFVIATKLKTEGKNTTVKSFLSTLDISLERLKLDYVDILYVHNPSVDEMMLPVVLEAVQTAKKLGKAKHVGVSTHNNEPKVIQAAIESKVYEVVLTSVNFKQDHYIEVKHAIEKAAKAGIGIVAMKTMAGGYLDRERKKPVNFKAALKFVMQDENITTCIPGMTSFNELNMNASVNTDLEMTPQERADLTMMQSESGLYCQGCQHCVENCPKGLPIPDIMRSYMYTYGYGDSLQAHNLLMSLNLPENPCGDCTACTAVCAKNFAVSERIADVMRLTKVPEEFLA